MYWKFWKRWILHRDWYRYFPLEVGKNITTEPKVGDEKQLYEISALIQQKGGLGVTANPHI